MQLTTCKRLLGMDDDTLSIEQQSDDNLEKGPTQVDEEETQYPSKKIVLPSVMAIYFTVLLTALDRTIIGVAIPAISNEFQSFGQIAWYEAAFLLTFSIFQLPMGKVYKFYPAKWVYVIAVVIFEVGSVVCAAAPSSVAFIIGRALSGVGGAALMVGGSVIFVDLLPLQKRPKYQGGLGAIFGLASVIGPLVGGAFTTKVTWRWCFWINLPIGGIAFAALVLVLPTSQPPAQVKGTFLQKLWGFDPVGNLALAPGLICIILALQWGGTQYRWSDARIIALLVVGGVLLVVFVGIQFWMKENATVPPRIMRQRSIASGAVASIGIGAALVIPTFYLPIWFQAIKNTSALTAGLRLLPYFLGTVFFVISTGIIISQIGYYTPSLVIGCSILVIGSGLLTTLQVDTSTGTWIGYQIVYGAGVGLSLMQTNIAAQTVLKKTDVSTGLTIMAFMQFFGGTIFVTLCQTILDNTLRTQLAQTLPGFDTSAIANTGATSIRSLVSQEDLPVVLEAYNAGIDNTFYCALGVGFLALVGSVFLEWKSVKPKK